ncbi:MAG: hypothetical protein JXR76_16815 [Deltaproteobacteria bacterium]|nr:hypothetical protein [Deltaproteobacteria bacterium]
MEFTEIFKKKAEHKCWQRIPDDKVIANIPSGTVFQKDKAYFVVRMSEMFIRNSRKLWRKFYPILHGFTMYRKTEVHEVVGPGQLKELSASNVDRITTFNCRLSGPIAFLGDDIQIVAGLYAVPGGDAAKALLDTVSTISGLGGLDLGTAMAITQVVKSGVESILNLDEAQLQIGINDSFYSNNPLRAGFHVAINAKRDDVDFTNLWLKNGHLLEGADISSAKPYDAQDYMVLEIEHRDHLDDWAGLPELAGYDKAFSEIIKNANLMRETQKSKLNEHYIQFREAVKTSKALITPDKERICQSVANDLKDRMSEVVLFESACDFDFLEIAERMTTFETEVQEGIIEKSLF